MSPYEVLGVQQGADKETCKAAYRRLAKKYHPDSPGGDKDKFDEVAKAWEYIESGKGVTFKHRTSGVIHHTGLFRFKFV